MTAHVLTRAELQAWVDVLSDDEERKAMQAKLDKDPEWVRKRSNRCIAAADYWYLGWPVEARHGPPMCGP
jgi:hypothetical protein